MTLEEKSYIYGILAADGNLYLQSRNRGRFSLELNIKDKDIIEKINDIIPFGKISYRKRITNFGYNSVICYTNYRYDFRKEIISMGYPIFNKTTLIAPPIVEYDENAFWRGFFDGDGSYGITKNNKPFIALTTKSERMKLSFLSFLFNNFNIAKEISRNKRDDIYNIVVFNEQAIAIAMRLYDNATIFMDRKHCQYLKMLQWQRTVPMASPRKKWTMEDDEYILTHSVSQSAIFLGRTLSSVKNRLFRLHQQK